MGTSSMATPSDRTCEEIRVSRLTVTPLSSPNGELPTGTEKLLILPIGFCNFGEVLFSTQAIPYKIPSQLSRTAPLRTIFALALASAVTATSTDIA